MRGDGAVQDEKGGGGDYFNDDDNPHSAKAIQRRPKKKVNVGNNIKENIIKVPKNNIKLTSGNKNLNSSSKPRSKVLRTEHRVCGCCNKGVRKVLSTTNKAPHSRAIPAMARMSVIRSSGLLGVSTQIIFGRCFLHARRTFSVSVKSTNSVLNRPASDNDENAR